MRRWWTRALIAMLLAASIGACARGKVVYVRDGDPVQLRQPVHNVKVWVYNEKGEREPSTMDEIPEGWWVVNLPKEETNE